MKFKSLLVAAILLFGAVFCNAQTNQYYHATEMDVQAGPSIWVSPFSHPLYGISVEGRYWENIHTATALEVGNNNVTSHTYPGINYMSTKQYFRVVPFSQEPFWGRIAVDADSGLDRWLYDGATGILIGVDVDYAFTPRLGATIDFDEHFANQRQDSGASLKAVIQFKF